MTTTTTATPKPALAYITQLAQLAVHVDTLAAVGATLAAEPGTIDPVVSARLGEVLEAAGFDGVDQLEPQERAMVAGMARTLFNQAGDLFDHPTRSPGWAHTDAAVLEGQGRASSSVVGLLAAVLGDIEVGSMLDVGTGVGLIAVAAAQQWPTARVVGLDIWEPALERAHANVTAAALGDRVEIRDQDVTELNDRDAFDLSWIPGFFLPKEVLPTAIERVVAATKPGGTVVVGVWREAPDPLAAATQRLRTERDGGAMHDQAEVIEHFAAAGFDATVLNPDMPIPLALIGGRRP